MILKMIKTVMMMISSQAMSGKKLCRIREWAICSSHVDQLPIAEQSLLLHHFASGHDDDQDVADDDDHDGADDIDNNIHL